MILAHVIYKCFKPLTWDGKELEVTLKNVTDALEGKTEARLSRLGHLMMLVKIRLAMFISCF